ncbi:MAG TPA: polysaccharide deacetylase family protein [Kineosporiaceae bacterium]
MSRSGAGADPARDTGPGDGRGHAARWPRAVAAGISRVAGAQLVASFATRAPLVALTVDDGPHPRTTPGLLDALASAGARATFFVIGAHGERCPELLRDVASGGHELGNHLWQGSASVLLPAVEFDRDLAATHALLAAHGPVRWFRPGSGWFTPRMLRSGARLGYRCALGSPGLATARYPDPTRVAFRFAARCRAGDVVVLHEGAPHRAAVADVVRALVAELARRGLQATTLSELAARSTAPRPA